MQAISVIKYSEQTIQWEDEMKKRIEIEEADNGYVITVYGGKKEEKDDDGYPMYQEPEKLVAESNESVLEQVNKFLK